MNDIKVMIVDDHEIVRFGLTHLFEEYDGLTVVAVASTLAEALRKVEEFHPDVLVLDIRLGRSNGIEACQEVSNRYPNTKTIMLTSYGQEDLVFDSILAGARGYVLKDVGNEEIIRAVRAVYKGESLLDPVVTKGLLERMRRTAQKPNDDLQRLTERERKVLGFVAEGKTNKEIATAIYLSEKTVRNYVSSILAKLNLANRTEAAAFAARRNMADNKNSL